MEVLNNSVDWLAKNPWISVLSFFLAILGVVLAIVFYLKSKRTKAPRYALKSNNIVRDLVDQIESLEMRYRGTPIRNLTVTKMAFWNAGSDTINHQDIAAADPLAVRTKEGHEILDAKILCAKNPANQFSILVREDRSGIDLNFDYLDREEGVVIQIIHTGKSSRDLAITGTVKGAGAPVKKTIGLPPSRSRRELTQLRFDTARSRRALGISALIVAAAMGLVGIVSTYLASLLPTPWISTYQLPLILALLLISALYAWLGLLLLRRTVPKGLEAFEE